MTLKVLIKIRLFQAVNTNCMFVYKVFLKNCHLTHRSIVNSFIIFNININDQIRKLYNYENAKHFLNILEFARHAQILVFILLTPLSTLTYLASR